MPEQTERDQKKTDVEQRQRPQAETSGRTEQQRDQERGGMVSRRPSGGLERGFGDPSTMLNTLHREMDRIFGDFGFGGSLWRSPFFQSARELDRDVAEIGQSIWSPQIEVYEKDGKLHVSADLPGLGKDDVKCEVKDNVLTIEGERRTERSDEKGAWSERSYGHFFRSIPLPDGVNADSANARFENGVLNITLNAPPKKEQRGRRIDIR